MKTSSIDHVELSTACASASKARASSSTTSISSSSRSNQRRAARTTSRVALHADDRRSRRQGTRDSRHTAAAEAEDQHPPTPRRRQEQNRGGERIPDGSRERGTGLVPGRETCRRSSAGARDGPSLTETRSAFCGFCRLVVRRRRLPPRRSRFARIHCRHGSASIRRICHRRRMIWTSRRGGLTARVALPVPVDELFDYSVPEALDESRASGLPRSAPLRRPAADRNHRRDAAPEMSIKVDCVRSKR